MRKMFESLVLDRENFESYFDSEDGINITDELWDTVIDDVEGLVANYLDEILNNIVLDIKEGIYNA
jgi:hypothetical protein